MSFSGSTGPNSSGIHHVFQDLDVDSADSTEAMDIQGRSSVWFDVQDGGSATAHTTHIVDLEGSNDKVNWTSLQSKTGLGPGTLEAVGDKWIRFTVSTLEGSASTADISVTAK